MNSAFRKPSALRTGQAFLTIVAACGCLVLLLIGGCSATMRLGRFPDTAQLERQLRPAVSGKADVSRILGLPRGGGRVMLPRDGQPRDLWYYYYEEGAATENRRIFLFIFFKQDSYDGYFWFSNLPGVSIREE